MSKLPLLIGVTGNKFHGKNTLANFFVKNNSFVELAFADALKEMCALCFGFNKEQLYGNSKEIEDQFWKTTPRKVLQFVGTDLFRNQLGQVIPDLGEDIWIKVVEKKILDIRATNPNVGIVITDVRFDNEVTAIHKLGGVVVRVTRPSLASQIDTHESEQNIKNLDADIDVLNNGTKEELYNNFNAVYEQMYK